LRLAAVDAAKRVFVLAKKWERTGQYGGEMREARNAAKDAANAYFDDRNDPSGQAVGMATAVALLILYNNSKSALELLPTLRDKLSALDVDVAALEREAGLWKNSRRRVSLRR